MSISDTNTNYDSDKYDDEDVLGDITSPIPVSIMDRQVQLQPEFGSCQSFTVPQSGATTYPQNCVQIMNRRPSRKKARIFINSNGGTTPNGGASYTGEGTAVDPAAGTTVAALNAGVAIPAGTYVVQGTNMLAGAATAADINNFGLYVGATLIQTLGNDDVTEQLFQWGPITITVPSGGAIVAIKTIGAGSGTANYWSAFQGAPQSGSSGAATSVIISSNVNALANPVNPQGFSISAFPFALDWENQEPCYATAIGGAGVVVSVLDQSYATDLE
jgi:hypothetical protein